MLESVALNEIGGRQNNEDSIYPAKGSASTKDRLFLVCDGVGGQDKGEVASKLITTHFPDYMKEDDRATLEGALRHAESRMNRYLTDRPETKGMASTLTVINFDTDDQSARVGWVGDSRIYQIREGQILFKSKDHSEVQSLVDMGEITEEEALVHPRRNVITRAVNGHTPARMDEVALDDIQEGDYFLLCTDGLLETLHEKQFPDLFMADHSLEEIKAKLLTQARGNTKDNFSMYLLKLGASGPEDLGDLIQSGLNKIGRMFRRFGTK